MGEKMKSIEISCRGICDYCKDRMKFAGTTIPEEQYVRRSCEKHKNKLKKDLKRDKS